MVAVSGVSGGSEFVSGSSLSLICSIQPQGAGHVDTPTTVMSSWDAPSSEYDRDNPANASSVVLDIASLQTADTGDYTCSASVSDSSGSGYVMHSEEVTDTVSITVSKYGEWGGLYCSVCVHMSISSMWSYIFHRTECNSQPRLHVSTWGSPRGFSC